MKKSNNNNNVELHIKNRASTSQCEPLIRNYLKSLNAYIEHVHAMIKGFDAEFFFFDSSFIYIIVFSRHNEFGYEDRRKKWVDLVISI